eukprot:s2289_g5.t1
MLRVFAISGTEVASFSEAVLEEAAASSDGVLRFVRSELEQKLGVPRFRLRLLKDQVAATAAALSEGGTAQVVVLSVVTNRIEDLLEAIHEGDESAVEQILEAPQDPDTTCGQRSALCVAAAKGNLEVVRLLQQARASVNNADAQGRGPLQIAASGQHDMLVKSLVDGAADVNHRDLGGRSAFLWACLRGHIGIAGCLKKASADINCTDVQLRGALHLAAPEGHAKMVEFLLESRCAIAADRNGDNPLHGAAARGRADVVTGLLRAQAELDKGGLYGKTPLQLAALNSRLHAGLEVLYDLLAARADCNKANTSGRAPLHFAADCGATKAAKALLQARAEVDLPDAREMTPLLLAANHSHLDVVRHLIGCRADLHRTDALGWAAMHHAAASGQVPVARFLLQARADLHHIDKAERTPLFTGAESGSLEMVTLLVDSRADPTARDAKGWQAWRCAEQRDFIAVSHYLLAKKHRKCL